MVGDEGEAGQEGVLLRLEETGWLILKETYVVYWSVHQALQYHTLSSVCRSKYPSDTS